MIDLHCHILPGLDDGPLTEADSVALARSAYRHGTRTIVATPHVREDYPFPLDAIATGVDELRCLLAEKGVPIDLLKGAELALSHLPDIDPSQLSSLSLGHGRCVLVESPYLPVGQDVVERSLFELQARGFTPILAHPERSPAFLDHPERLARLVRRGVLCSVTATSMSGRFGRVVQQFTSRLFRERLVHNVASDAHSAAGRPPALSEGFAALSNELEGIDTVAAWFTVDAPAAILAGREVGEPPELHSVRRRRIGLRRGRP